MSHLKIFKWLGATQPMPHTSKSSEEQRDSQTKDDNGSPGCPITPGWERAQVDVQMGPKAAQQSWPSSHRLASSHTGLLHSRHASRALPLRI